MKPPCHRRAPRGGELIANGCATAVVASCLLAGRFAPDLHARLAQEDEVLEWATFWSLALAGGFFLALVRRRPARSRWFACGLVVFCWFVALEEISWGQRLFGYRPPTFFLENNLQQELNFHNLAHRIVRKVALAGTLLCYGIVLPLGILSLRSRRWIRTVGAIPPSIGVVPIFAMALVIYLTYPVRLSGEWVELLLGLGLLLASCLAVTRRRKRTARVLLVSCVVAALALVSTSWSLHVRSSSREAVAVAEREVETLAGLVTVGSLVPGKNIHLRLRTHAREWPGQGLPAEAAERFALVAGERGLYYLDPWNMPYWIKYRLDDNGTFTGAIYSFGPNRVRESRQREILGDDVGASIPATTMFSPPADHSVR